jgi:hypothetical protein
MSERVAQWSDLGVKGETIIYSSNSLLTYVL